MYDCVIVGAGCGGLTAAIYLLRSNLKVAIVEESMPGGQVANTARIENYPGFEAIDGVTLATNMYMQATNLGLEYFGEKAESINKTDDGFEVKLTDSTLHGKTLIIATGMKHRVLGIPNENKLAGKGISWCAICDGSLYRGKDVAVVGGGNSALEESLYLSKIVNKVYLIHRRDQFRAEPLLVDKIKATKNIELVLNDEITGLNGQDFLESIDLKNNPQIKVDGLFEYIGFLPSSELVTKFNITDEAGFIIADENCETPIPKMFAIGDVRQKKVRQIVTAISDGAIAALQVNKCFG